MVLSASKTKSLLVTGKRLEKNAPDTNLAKEGGDWVGAVGARRHVFLSSVTQGVKCEENSFILNNMLGKNDQNGTRQKREDC